MLAARARLKAWPDVDALFTSKNWLGVTKKRSPLSFQRVVDILQKNSAPAQVSGRGQRHGSDGGGRGSRCGWFLAGAAGVRRAGGGGGAEDRSGSEAQVSRHRHQRESPPNIRRVLRGSLRRLFLPLSTAQTYRDMKDRQLLVEYRKKVDRGSAEEIKIDMLLNNSVRRSATVNVVTTRLHPFYSSSAADPVEKLMRRRGFRDFYCEREGLASCLRQPEERPVGYRFTHQAKEQSLWLRPQSGEGGASFRCGVLSSFDFCLLKKKKIRKYENY